MKCADCRWWSRCLFGGGKSETGECRRCAPVKPTDNQVTFFPLTTEDCWCGEFKKQKGKIPDIPIPPPPPPRTGFADS